MNRREDPLLRQHRSRLLQLAEATNIKPGRGSGKRRGQRQSHGFGPSNGGPSRVTLQDIVRSDPGYTPNIEHLVFPERKSSNPNLAGVVDGSPPNKSKSNATSSGRSRLAEVFARHYARGSSQDSSVTSRKNHVNSTSLDSGSAIGHQPGPGGPTVVTRNAGRRWLSQNSQSSRQHSAEDGVRGSSVGVGGPVSTLSSSQVPGQAAPPALPPRRVSPAADTNEITNAGPISRVDRGPNVSILHLRNASADPWEVGSQGSSYSVGSNKSQTASSRGKSGGNARGSYNRGSSIPSLKRHDTSTSTTPSSLKQHRQDSHGQVSVSSRRRDAVNSFLSGNSGTSGELFISGNCSRELSPVRWCDREVDGVYLGRSGWVQVQQRSLDENRRANYESNLVTATTGTLPLSRRAVKLADYHCNSEPGKCPQDFTRGLDSQRPDFLALHSQDFDSITTSACTSPHSIPESFSPPSITPIISPPPAFQDAVAGRKSSSSRHLSSSAVRSNYGSKAPFLPRSNAIVDSDIISPPPSPPPHQVNWSSLPSASRKNSGLASSRSKRQNASQQQQQQQQYRMAQAKSLEDQSSSRRSQFAQRYMESSSSSSSSMGFRSLDSCVTKPIMPSLVENTDSSVEGYEDGDEDDNPSSSLNLSLVSSSALALNSSTESIRANGERISPNRRIHRSQQGLRRSPGSSESGKQMFNSPSSSSSSSSSEGRQGRSPTPNPFRRGNPSRQHQSARTNQVSPDSHQSRVRRSRSLQLPEKRSPGTTGPQRDHSRESNEAHRVVVKIMNDRGSDRSKRHVLQNRKAQSTDDTINENLFRETEMVTEYLYGTRSRVVPRNLLSSRYERRDESQEQRRSNSNTYDVYIISSKQQQQQSSKASNPSQSQQQQQQQSQQQQQQQQQQQSRRPRTLQRGATTPNANAPSANQDFCISPDTKLRCNSSTCDFWPHCSQRETLYSPNQAPPPVFMKLSQSYPAHQRLSTDAGSHRGSASSSPASLERMDERELRERDNLRKSRSSQQGKYQERPKSVLKQANRWSPLEGINGNGSGVEKRDQMHHRVYRKPDFPGSFESADSKDRRVSPIQGLNIVNRSPSGGPIASSSTTTSSSSSSDIWVTTSDRTVTKSPRNAKSSGASTPMEDAVIGSLKTLIEPPKDGTLSRPGSAPTRGEDSLKGDIILDPHQRSLSLPKSFLAHNTADGRSTSWQRGQDSQRSSPSPSRLRRAQEAAASHTAPVSPLHDYRTSGHAGRERRRIPGLSKAQRRIKASSTPALLDRNHDSRQWSGDEEDEGTRAGHVTTEHPLVEATIPLVSHSRLQEQSSVLNVANVPTGGSQNATHRAQSQQESVLQKFRKSFSLRFHKKGSKESNEECPAEDNDGTGPLDEEEGAETPSVTTSDQSSQHKDDSSNDQKFRFGPLVWRSSKERKKGNKAARNAKCNSGDSGIQIEMVSGGALTGGSGGGVMGAGDSSESHDTDDIPDDTDSPPALRRRVADKLRPQSELINQILIDKFKADLQNRTSRHNHVRRTNSDLGGQRLLQWDTRSGYVHNYRRMLSTPSPIKTRPPRLSPRHSSHDIVTLRSNAKGRSSRTNLRRSLSQPLGINQLSPLMRAKTAVGARLPGGNVLSEDEQDGRAGTSEDDEMMSDSESSIASLTDKKKSFEQTMDEEIVMLAEAVWDHVAMEPEELAFRAGDVIDVLDTLDKDWWWGSCRGEHGWFPAAFVRLRVSQEDTVEDCLAAMASGGSSGTQLRRRTSVSLLSNEQVRASVVRELVQTERDFVKVLRDVAEGYIAECRRRTDMFTEEQIETIFINLEELLDFQSEFLKDLEDRIDWNAPYKSCVGECFLNHRAGFRMYSEYCNSHPMATATLQELYQHNRYSKFFEACRLMRGLIEIPLDGYLLTPIQRICKYPLQLAELLKYTKTDHPDYHKIQEALEAMRDVAVLINERKRRMESLEKLAAWQMRVEGWEGEDLIEVSSQLIYQGEAMRVKTGMWTNNITLFLFDHQLVYCKKDILKRNTYVYKGRIYLDTSEVIDVPDGKDLQSGVTVRHCLKVYSCVRDKWLLFCCRTAEEKRRWLAAMDEERRLVAQDRNDGLEFPAAARQLARLAASRQQNRPPIKPRNKTYKRESAYEMPTTMVGQGTTNSLGRKVGTWFMFGSSKKSTRLQPS